MAAVLSPAGPSELASSSTKIISSEPIISQRWSNTEESRLFKVKFHQLEMLRDRGYLLGEEEIILTDPSKNSVDFFLYAYNLIQQTSNRSFQRDKSTLNRYYQHKVDGHRLAVFYLESEGGKSTGKKEVEDAIRQIGNPNQGITRVIMITDVDLTSQGEDLFDGMPEIRFEVFLYNQLKINPTKHYLVPRHRVLSAAEKTAFLKKNNLDISKLPRMKYDDPIARYYGLEHLQIVEIHRINLSNDTLVNKFITFRVVVSGKIRIDDQPQDPNVEENQDIEAQQEIPEEAPGEEGEDEEEAEIGDYDYDYQENE